MLQNDKSHYYALIKDTVDHVEEQHLLDFGMNLRYNSYTIGASIIRKIEKNRGLQYSMDACPAVKSRTAGTI